MVIQIGSHPYSSEESTANAQILQTFKHMNDCVNGSNHVVIAKFLKNIA